GIRDFHVTGVQTCALPIYKTILQEFYQVAFRRKIYQSIDELQHDLDDWMAYYNSVWTHQGKMCCGRTSMQTLIDAKEIWDDKIRSEERRVGTEWKSEWRWW